MAYDDDELGRIFPTRTGDPTGTANERKMLDILGGANNIRTKVQRFVEGSKITTTRLRTRAGNPEFVTEITDDEDEEFDVYMDSGVVDLLSVAESNPDSYKSAPLYYGTIQKAYVVLKKLLGKIVPPKTKCKPPEDTKPGKSFKISLAAITSTPDGLVGKLYIKKVCAARCPASMFTGRARIYAQAQYGAPLKQWRWEIDQPIGLSPRLVHDNGAVLNTNSGIYLDDDKKHWLLTVHPGGVLVTKMVRDDRVKPLARHLRNPSMAADWMKIEAYILAYSHPSPSSSFNIPITIPETQMLGYGWKFNMKGDKADIIQHIEGSPNHTSTHYRITFKRDGSVFVPATTPPVEAEQMRWSAVVSVVQGPVTWHNARYSSVIASPDWLTNTLYIFGTLSGGIIGSNVPLYCFYDANDVLKVFRYNGSGGESALRYSVVSDPPQWMRPFAWSEENVGDYTHFGSVGMEGAEGERRVRAFNPSIAGITCDSAGANISAQSYQFDRYTLSGKTYVGDGPVWNIYNTGFNAYALTCHAEDTGPSPYYTLSDGVIRYTSGVNAWCDTGSYIGYGTGSFDNTAVISYDRFSYIGAHTEDPRSLLLIPFYDAEAAYLRAELHKEEHAEVHGGTVVPHIIQPGFFVHKTTYVFSDGMGGYTYYSFFTYAGGDGTHLSNNYDAAPDYDMSEDTVYDSKLITRSGAYDFSPPSSLLPFFAGVPYVEQQYNTHTAGVGAGAFGHGAKNLEGFPDIFESPPPFIGWA